MDSQQPKGEGLPVKMPSQSVRRGQQFLPLLLALSAPGALAALSACYSHQPVPPLLGVCCRGFSSHFFSPLPLSLAEAINCLMRAIEIYTDMVRVAGCRAPSPQPSLASPAAAPSGVPCSTAKTSREAGALESLVT